MLMGSQNCVPLLLLKTQSQNDGYQEYFGESGRCIPVFVPVLEHRFNLESLALLASQIRDGAFSKQSEAGDRDQRSVIYEGLVFTSQRAVEAFASVVQNLKEQSIDVNKLFWSELPIYVVGPATGKGIRALDLPCSVLGEESGNGDALAEFILVTHAGPRNDSLLFLVGEQRRDIIPNTLQSEDLAPAKRIGVKELTVYETGEMASFREDFKMRLAEAKEQNAEEQWAVVFSPSGCRAMLEGIGICDSEGHVIVDEPKRTTRTTKVATIGPTTKAFLQRECGFEPDACAARPSPKGLAEAIDYATEGA